MKKKLIIPPTHCLVALSCLTTLCHAGGSNLVVWQVDSNCSSDYGVIKNYNNIASTIVDPALDAMRANGQDKLRLMIFHTSGGSSDGSTLNSSGGTLSGQEYSNFTNLLNSIHSKGFNQVQFAFAPTGSNNPSSWSSWDETIYQENWVFITNVRQMILNAGMTDFGFDLLNEALPTQNDMVVQYMQRLWIDFAPGIDMSGTYGKNNTVGFSIRSGSGDDFSNIGTIYSNNIPYTFDVHVYGVGYTGTYNQTAHDDFIHTQTKLISYLGYSPGWYIGETFLNDAPTAAALRDAMNETSQPVYFVLQWGVNPPDNACNAFNNYGDVGLIPGKSSRTLAEWGNYW